MKRSIALLVLMVFVVSCATAKPDLTLTPDEALSKQIQSADPNYAAMLAVKMKQLEVQSKEKPTVTQKFSENGKLLSQTFNIPKPILQVGQKRIHPGWLLGAAAIGVAPALAGQYFNYRSNSDMWDALPGLVNNGPGTVVNIESKAKGGAGDYATAATGDINVGPRDSNNWQPYQSWNQYQNPTGVEGSYHYDQVSTSSSTKTSEPFIDLF